MDHSLAPSHRPARMDREQEIQDRAPEADERHAILRCRAGDRDAFRLIVDRYGVLLFGTAYLMTGDRGHAEDAVQDALLSAWRGLERFDVERPVRPWLLRILINSVLQRRRRKLLGVVPLGEAALQLPDPGPLPDDEFEHAARRDAVRRAVAALPPELARALILQYFAGLAVAEIAEILSVPEGTVKSRLHRARRQLHDELGRRGLIEEK